MIKKSKITLSLLISIFTGLFDTFRVDAVKKVRSAQRKTIKKKTLKNKRKRGRSKGWGKKKQGGDRTRNTITSVTTGGGESVKMVDQKQEDKNEKTGVALRIGSKKSEGEKTDNSGERKRSQGANQERTMALAPSNVDLSIPLKTSLIKSTIENPQVDDGGGEVLVVSAEQKDKEDKSLRGGISILASDNLASERIGDADQFNFKKGRNTSADQSQESFEGQSVKVETKTITGGAEHGLLLEEKSRTEACSELRDFSSGSDSGRVSVAINNQNRNGSLFDQREDYFSETEPLLSKIEMKVTEKKATGGLGQKFQQIKQSAERLAKTVGKNIKEKAQSLKDTVANSDMYKGLKNSWGGTNKVSEKKSEIP